MFFRSMPQMYVDHVAGKIRKLSVVDQCCFSNQIHRLNIFQV